jgi:CarboxypepD_reg-like domain/TonB dependent receptor/TonB-dependent Receptor Plug Domain
MHLHKSFKAFASLYMFLFTVCFTTNAQVGTGKLTGKIKDSATNQSLLGVSVTIKGINKGVASINDGSYILTLSPGTYTIRYSYSGYNTKDISEVIIKKGETEFIDILLSPKSNQMAGVVVTSTSARKETQSAVYNKQRLSAAASDGISAETISKTPDNNAGQILKRVTGVSVQNDKFVVVRGLGAQYNQTMLNGVAMTSTETDKNAFSFDLIPAAAIDNIVVNKTATPDMPGNFAGGVVQVNTKDFPAKDFFSVAVQTGFSDQTYGKDFYSDKRSKMEWLGFGGKSRDLPNGFPKANESVNIYNVNIQERFRLARLLKNNLVPYNNGPSGKDLADLNENIQFGFGKTFRFKQKNQLGIIAAITQRKTELIENDTISRLAQPAIQTDGSPAVAIGRYANTTRFKYSSEFAVVLNFAYSFGSNKVTIKNLYTQLFRNTFTKSDSIFNPSVFNYQGPKGLVGFSYTSEQRSLLNSILSGEHKLGKNKETILDWNINVTANNSKFPDNRNYVLNTTSSPEIFEASNPANIVSSLLQLSTKSWLTSNDFITGGALNLSSVFNINKVKQIFKGGILFQNRGRTSTSNILPLNLGTTATLDSIAEPSLFVLNGNEIFPIGFENNAGNYNAGSSLQAFYESLENKIGKTLRIIWGIRFENYQQTLSSYKLVSYPNFRLQERVINSNKLASRTTFNFLPSINLIYTPNKTINIRGAFSKTVIRPDLKDIAPFSIYDFKAFRFVTGNADLRSTSVNNYDLKVEWFPSSGEIVSVAAFYKKMIDPIEFGENISVGNPFVGRLPINSGIATVKGLEAEFRKKLNFISFAPFMKHVTLFGNGALLKSFVENKTLYYLDYNFSPEHRLTGQPKYIINAGINIEAFKNTFEATLTYNRTGDYIDQLGSSDFFAGFNPYNKPLLYIPNFILKARDVIDISIRQKLLKGKGLIKFNIANLLSEPLIIYQDFNGNDKYDKVPFKTNINRSSQLGTFDGAIDNIASYTNGQRNFSLAFSYTF